MDNNSTNTTTIKLHAFSPFSSSIDEDKELSSLTTVVNTIFEEVVSFNYQFNNINGISRLKSNISVSTTDNIESLILQFKDELNKVLSYDSIKLFY